MKILGINLSKRFGQWVDAIILVETDWNIKMLLHVLYHAFLLGVSKRTWRRRYRTCVRCPVYRYRTKTCGNGGDIGCGCYTPFLAMTRIKECWGKEHFGIGWD